MSGASRVRSGPLRAAHGEAADPDGSAADVRGTGPGSRGGRFPSWLAHAFTLGRIALLPLLFLAAEATRAAVGGGVPSGLPRTVALLLMALIAASDRADGYVARRSRRGPTRRGAFLDALADRLVQWSGVLYFCFLARPGFTPLPLWLPAVLLGRELVLVGGWMGRRRSGAVSFEHERHGKAATVVVFGLLLAVIAGAPERVVVVLSALAAGAVAWSTARYVARSPRSRRPPGRTRPSS